MIRALIVAILFTLAVGLSKAGEVNYNLTGDEVAAVETQPEDRLVVYSATWCGPCQRLKPTLYALKREGYNVKVYDVDKDEDKLKHEYTAVPSLFYYEDGELVRKETGYRTRSQITRYLEKPDEEESNRLLDLFKRSL